MYIQLRHGSKYGYIFASSCRCNVDVCEGGECILLVCHDKGPTHQIAEAALCETQFNCICMMCLESHNSKHTAKHESNLMCSGVDAFRHETAHHATIPTMTFPFLSNLHVSNATVRVWCISSILHILLCIALLLLKSAANSGALSALDIRYVIPVVSTAGTTNGHDVHAKRPKLLAVCCWSKARSQR
jgi:hypothetical protein